MISSHVIILMLVIIITNYSFMNIPTEEEKLDKLDKEESLNSEPLLNQPVLGITYIKHNSTITISDNGDFLTQGFTGNGDINNPYVFENRSLSNSSSRLIHIQDTTAYFEIRNCSLNALYSNFNVITLRNVVNAKITRNIIQNCSTDGIELWASSNNNTIENNTILNCSSEGIYLHQTSQNNVIINNTISNCTEGGIYLWDSNSNNITKNVISYCNSYGIELLGSDNIRILNNTVFNISTDGIYITASDFTVFKNNTISSCNGYGIHIDSLYSVSDNCTISNNTISSCNGYGILVKYSDYCAISNNTISNCSGGSGIHISGYCYYNEIINNTISNCSNVGISMYFECENNIVVNNIIFNCSSGISISDDCFYNNISDNTISSCNGGIYLEYSVGNNTVEDNTISYCSSYGIWVIADDNNILDNTIFNCSTYGIWSRGCDNNISDNTISYCSIDGIYLENSNTNNILDNTIFNCSSYGIHLEYSYDNNLTSNTIFNCSIYSISLEYSHNTNIKNNTILNGGTLLYESHLNNLTSNTISKCSIDGFGIYLIYSDNNTLLNNTIFKNENYGLYITSNSDNNSVNYNTFIDNNIGSGNQQAFDDGTNNNISCNYWNEWITPDGPPPDGFVDIPYSINGTANNNDSFPLTTTNFLMVIIVTPKAQIYGTDNITVMLEGYSVINYWYYIEGVDSSNHTWTDSVDRQITIDGTYILHAFGNNSAGKNTSISVMFTIDTMAPNLTINNPLNTTYSQDSVTLIYTVSDGAIDIYIDGVVNITVNSGSVISNLADGSHNLTIIAGDQIGNINRTTIIFSIDTSPPIITLEFLTNNTMHHSGTVVDVSVTDVYLDTVLYNWDGNSNITWGGNYQTSLPSNEIQHFLYVYANDSLGNWTSEMFMFVTDDTNPSVNITSPVFANYSQNSVTLNYTVSDGIVTIYFNDIDNKSSLPSGSTISGLLDGSYNITIIAVDLAGNIGQDIVIFTIDTIPPTITIISPLNTTYNSAMVIIDFSGNAINYWYYIAGIDSVNRTWTSTSTRDLVNGSYLLHVYGNDSIGNQISLNVTFTIDTTYIPHILSEPEILTPNTGIYAKEITIKWNPAIDSHNHDIKYDLHYSNDDGSTWILITSDISETTFTWNVTNIPNGSSYRVKIIARCSEESVEVTSLKFTINNDFTIATTSTNANSTSGWDFFSIIIIGTILIIAKKKKLGGID